MTAAFDNFTQHIKQCDDAIHIYQYLKERSYSADFGLRFVWVAALSALDHYISELVVERATEHFASGQPLSAKMLNEAIPLAGSLKLHKASPTQAVVEFRAIITQAVRFRTFQKADDVTDGLAFIWNEQHKWNKIGEALSLQNRTAKYKLNNISYRRDRIVHNADYDESSGQLTECRIDDAIEVTKYIKLLVGAIENLIK